LTTSTTPRQEVSTEWKPPFPPIFIVPLLLPIILFFPPALLHCHRTYTLSRKRARAASITSTTCSTPTRMMEFDCDYGLVVPVTPYVRPKTARRLTTTGVIPQPNAPPFDPPPYTERRRPRAPTLCRLPSEYTRPIELDDDEVFYPPAVTSVLPHATSTGREFNFPPPTSGASLQATSTGREFNFPPSTSGASLQATSVNSVTFFLTQSQEQHDWSN